MRWMGMTPLLLSLVGVSSLERGREREGEKERGNLPSTLDTELLEESGGDDSAAAGEAVGVEEETADDGDDNDGEAPAEGLGGWRFMSMSCTRGGGMVVSCKTHSIR